MSTYHELPSKLSNESRPYFSLGLALKKKYNRVMSEIYNETEFYPNY